MNFYNEAAAEITNFLIFSSSCNLLMLHFPKAGLTLWLIHSTSWPMFVFQFRKALDIIMSILTLNTLRKGAQLWRLGPIFTVESRLTRSIFCCYNFFFCLVCYSLFDVTHNSLMAVYKYPLTWSIISCLKHRLSSHSAWFFFHAFHC